MSALTYMYFPSIVETKVREKLPLARGSDALKRWSKVKVPIYFKLYFFDVLNVDDVINNGATPMVKERGPYVFRESRERDTQEFFADGEIISYRDLKGFYFEREKSVGPLDDRVTVLDLTTMALIEKAWQNEYVAKAFDNGFSQTGQKLFNTFTVDELVNGYDIKMVQKLHNILTDLNIHVLENAKQRFGLLLGKNLSEEANKYSIKSGISNLDDIGQIQTWNRHSHLDYWQSSYCNMINGTDGTMFKPGLSSHESVVIFNAELCRSLPLVFKNVNYVRGIQTLRYHLPRQFFTAPNSEPENRCYCTKDPSSEDYQYCSVDGVLDVSSCRDAPLYLSAPHFFQGSAVLRENVIGLKPEAELHQTYLDIEPMTGVVLSAARRIQINSPIKRHSEISFLRNVNNIMMPLGWLEESATIDEWSAEQLDAKIFKKLRLSHALSLVGIGVGILFIVAAAIIWRLCDRKQYIKNRRNIRY